MDHRYEVYGLQLRSTEPLRGLLPGQTELAPDLDIVWCRDQIEQLSRQWSPLPVPQQSNNVTQVTLWRADDCGHQVLKLQYSLDSSVCDFVFDQQRRKLWVFFPDKITRGRLRSFLLGSVMSSILRLRGTLCLHASVVSIGQQAIAFAGRKGEGKSTTAAALAQHGAAILSDDIAAITYDDGQFVVHPGEMDIRLLESTVGTLYVDSSTVVGIDGKVRLRLTETAGQFGRFGTRALPLAAIYLFENAPSSSAEPTIVPVHPGGRYMSLFQHFYGFWLDKDLTHSADFKRLSELVNAVPIYRIQRQRNLEQLPIMCSAIIKSLADQNDEGAF